MGSLLPRLLQAYCKFQIINLLRRCVLCVRVSVYWKLLSNSCCEQYSRASHLSGFQNEFPRLNSPGINHVAL